MSTFLGGRATRAALVTILAAVNMAFSGTTTRHVAWSAVEFFPPDLARQVRKNHRRFDSGIAKGLAAPPAWRAGRPGALEAALLSQVEHCASSLRQPVPLGDLVEQLGVLAVRVVDANDPLAVDHTDPREPSYADAYQRYVDSVRDRVRLVYYGPLPDVDPGQHSSETIRRALARSSQLYPFVGTEFYRSGQLRDWRSFDDRSVAFGVAAVSLSRAMSDLANLARYVWGSGGGLVPTPRPTPIGHVGPTVTIALGGGLPDRQRPKRGDPVLPPASINLPPP
jgi:hypothetical protein